MDDSEATGGDEESAAKDSVLAELEELFGDSLAKRLPKGGVEIDLDDGDDEDA